MDLQYPGRLTVCSFVCYTIGLKYVYSIGKTHSVVFWPLYTNNNYGLGIYVPDVLV